MIYDALLVLTYYVPYVSGLTNVARDVAEGLAARGKKITVVASQHEPGLPLEEMINGVRVVRTPVLFKVGKGVVSPAFVATAARESKRARVLNIHAPMLEAGLVARVSSAPVVMTYQCDVSMPGTLLGQLQNWMLDRSTRMAARSSELVSVSSDDYASCSRVRDALSSRRIVIPPTCKIRPSGVPRFREGPGVHIGFLGRIVEEKGIEYLVDGFHALDAPDARLLIGGDFSAIAGGSVIERVRASIGEDSRIRLLGFLPEDDISDFYSSLDVFALPSVNPFEAFGIVQVEAMMYGIPVIATDLPGVRQPVLMTGMGEIIEPRNAKAVTDALKRILENRPDTMAGKARARELYSVERTLDEFERAFEIAARRDNAFRGKH